MKYLQLPFVLVSCMLFVLSCKKENTKTPSTIDPKPDTIPDNTAPLRLMSLQRVNDDSTVLTVLSFLYDGSGRVTGISTGSNSGTSMTKISYNGNQAVYAHPASNPFPGIYSTDTILFTIDSHNRALKRIEYSYFENDDTASTPHIFKTFISDTTTYEYDTAGLLTKETRVVKDSTLWIDNGAIHLNLYLHNTIANYHNSEGNIVEIDQHTVTAPGNQTEDKKVTFVYNNAYHNHAALTNPAVMNEMNLFYDWPLNDAYKNMPDKMTTDIVDKDGTGNIVYTKNSVYTLDLAFDANGYLDTYFDSNSAGGKWHYLYSR